MSFLSSIFGGKSAAPKDSEPLPGQGGYTIPRGPYGATGYPGSTPAAPKTHSQDPEENKLGRETVTENQAEWNNTPNTAQGAIPYNTGTGYPNFVDTERTINPVISRNVPGNQNQRNTRFYAGRQAAPDGNNRYVYGGENGGVESYAFHRRMPYSKGENGHRGASLSGERYYGDMHQFSSAGGSYGRARAAGPLHRPTVFVEPTPWTVNYYDTTAEVGTPDDPGTQTQAVNMSYVSPSVSRSRAWGM